MAHVSLARITFQRHNFGIGRLTTRRIWTIASMPDGSSFVMETVGYKPGRGKIQHLKTLKAGLIMLSSLMTANQVKEWAVPEDYKLKYEDEPAMTLSEFARYARHCLEENADNGWRSYEDITAQIEHCLPTHESHQEEVNFEIVAGSLGLNGPTPFTQTGREEAEPTKKVVQHAGNWGAWS